MGLEMAKNLLSAGLSIVGIDIDAERNQLFRQAGGSTAISLREIASNIDVVIVMVNEQDHMENALFNHDAIKNMKPGGVVVSTSTVSPTYIRKLSARLHEHGIGLIDSPVSGGVKGAREGTLTLMLSGSPAEVQKVRAELEAISSKIFTVGTEPGIGSTFKVVHQHLGSTHIALSVEAMGLCKKSGIDPAMFYDVVINSAGSSRIFESFVPLLLANDFFPYSSINTSEKDLRLVVDLAAELDYPVEIARQAYKQFASAKKSGWGKESSISTIRHFPVSWEDGDL